MKSCGFMGGDGNAREMDGAWAGADAVLDSDVLRRQDRDGGVRTGTDTTTGRLSNRGTSGTETPAGRNRNAMEDGSYYAGTDGAVKRRSAGETEWEKLGRELRESWDKMMDGAEDAAQNTERAAENAVRGTERAAKDAVRDVEHGV